MPWHALERIFPADAAALAPGNSSATVISTCSLIFIMSSHFIMTTDK